MDKKYLIRYRFRIKIFLSKLSVMSTNGSVIEICIMVALASRKSFTKAYRSIVGLEIKIGGKG
jgi:hypothetical protein